MDQVHFNVLRKSLWLLIASVALLAMQLIANAQTDTGRIAGVVKDQNGAVVPGASVIAINDRTGQERTTTTTTEGQYVITSLRPSIYTVTVSAPNFSESRTNSVQVLVGQEMTLNIALTAAGVSAQVTVEGGTDPAINTESASMGANVNPREVAALPLNGRQLSQLYLQAPGSSNAGSGTYGDIRFNGRAVEQNVIRYDGI